MFEKIIQSVMPAGKMIDMFTIKLVSDLPIDQVASHV
jgi:hypothetical protein